MVQGFGFVCILLYFFFSFGRVFSAATVSYPTQDECIRHFPEFPLHLISLTGTTTTKKDANVTCGIMSRAFYVEIASETVARKCAHERQHLKKGRPVAGDSGVLAVCHYETCFN